MFGVCWKPPMNSQSRRSAKGVFEPGDLNNIRHQLNRLIRPFLLEQSLFDAAYHPCLIRLINQVILPLLCFLRFPSRLRIVGELRLAFVLEGNGDRPYQK